MPETQPSPQSLAELVSGAIADTQGLVRDQIELTKVELQDTAKKAAKSSALFIVAGVVGFLGIIFLLVTAAYGLVALGLAVWAGFGIVTLVLLIMAAILVLVGRRQAREIKPPQRSIAAASAIAGSLSAK
ncbi:MAG: phage holin family protein [Candidatus Nanopelagicales bacterium]